MAQQGFGPPSLPVGTEVSAKYRGAFCEAKVKSVVRLVKCRVVVKDGQSSVFVNDEEIKGCVKLGAVVEVKHPETNQYVEATINKLTDHSSYTVVFDDGDERTLRRTQLCLKGDKHFIESETLDNLPLSHPEHFGTPVLQNKKAKRKNDDESDEEVVSSEEESPRRATYRGRHQELVGKLMLVDLPQRKGSVVPALVVLPDANSLNEVKNRDQILVRSFKDSKFMVVTRKDLKEFTRAAVIKNDDKTMRTAIEKALLYFDTKELPVGWNKEEMLGSDVDDDEGEGENEYASEDEPFEEKDRFVAQLYKFMDDRGTPINKGPCIGNKDLNLYKLFKIVQNLGGYNKVTKEMKWAVVYSKMGLPSLHQNPAHQIKTAYKKYLDAYETFYRKLGSTMGTHSRPGRSRQNSSRSILNFRGRERSPRSPKPPEKSKDDAEAAKRKTEALPEKVEDEVETVPAAAADENDVVTRRTPRRDPKTQTAKEESKDKKEDTSKAKKEDKKEEVPKTKKDDKKDEKVKKDTPMQSVKVKEEKAKEDAKKDDKKPVKKPKGDEEGEKEDKKPEKITKKDEEKKVEIKIELTPNASAEKESPKKRVTRRKLLPNDLKSEFESKEEEEKKELAKKAAAKILDKALEKKEIPKTLEKREKSVEKKEAALKKEMKPCDKKPKTLEEKKIKKDKKMKEDNGEEPPEMHKSGPSSSQSDEEDENETEKVVTDPKMDFPIGSKLKVKYGRGKNQKIYIAKVIDFGKEGVHKTYLVHYAGWNTRYDEWIRPDRVVSVLDKPSDGEGKAKLALTKPPRLSGGPKISPSLKSASQVFRTPKMAGAKTRATRSSSSDTSIVSKTAEKMITRRRSILADSTGSVSPGSQNSSDAEDNTGSERADDEDENTKSEKEEDEDDILNVDEEFEDDREKFTDHDTSLEDEDDALKIASSDTGSERVENEEMEEMSGLKESMDSESIEEMSPEAPVLKAAVEGKTECKVESVKTAQETSKKLVPRELKPERASVFVSEVKNAVDEIKSAVYEECSIKENSSSECDSDHKEVLDCLDGQEELQEITAVEDIKNEEKIDSVDERAQGEDQMPEKLLPPVLSEESASPKVDSSSEQEKKESEKPKLGRGRKKEAPIKDVKKSLKTEISSPSEPLEVTAADEQPAPPSNCVTPKAEPSPYDFDGDADIPPWQPEITKKWEPSSKVQAKDSKDPNLDEGDDKEKKKVKKKVKRKTCPDTEAAPKPLEENEEVSNLGIKEDSQNSSVGADNSGDKLTGKKKGRKKKELSTTEMKKEVIEQYESTVNSVVEAVKHSLMETESDLEPNIKRRRVKRASESDKKDTVMRVGKMGRKVASRDCLDAALGLHSEDSKKEPLVNSNEAFRESPTVETAAPSTSSSSPLVGADVEETSGHKNKRKEPSFSESQGFEAHSEQESGAPFDNTPPTTPEHDEETNGCSQPNNYNSSDAAAKTDASSTFSLSSAHGASSSTLAPSKPASESPSDNDVTSTESTDNMDSLPAPPQQSESSGTDQDVPVKRRKVAEESLNGTGSAKKKKRIHGTRSRTAQKSPKYVGNSDSQGSASNTPNHCPESPPIKFPDVSKSPRPSKYNFSADLGEYLEGEARCNFLISKMREIKTIYMSLKSEVASIDRRRKRAKRKERESSQISASEKETST